MVFVCILYIGQNKGYRSKLLLRSFVLKSKLFTHFIHSTEPRVVLFHKTGGSNPIGAIEKEGRGTFFFYGWGWGIRTPECWYQKPVPYHLANPQRSDYFII